MKRSSLLLGVALLAALLPLPAAAHSLGPNMNALWVGLLHPVLAVEQGLTFLVLGISQARYGDSLPKWMFPALLSVIAAMFLLFSFVPLEGNGATQGLPLLGAGLMLLVPFERFRAYVPVALLALGAVLGAEIGIELPTGASPVLFLCGIGFAAVILLAYAQEFWTRFYRPWFDIAVRIVGSWFIAVAVILVGASFRPMP